MIGYLLGPLVNALVLAGYRCGLMELAEFSAGLMVRRCWAVLVRHWGRLFAFLFLLSL